MVSPYPPARDGLASYAVQEVKRLQAEGHEVEVLSPGPSAAHHHLDLRGARGLLALAGRVTGYERVIVQYHPAIFFRAGSGATARAATTALLAVAFRRAGNVELRVHEFDRELRERSRRERWLARAMWRAAERIVVHTDAEQQHLAAVVGLDPWCIEVTDHGAHLVRGTSMTRPGAPARLDLPADTMRRAAGRGAVTARATRPWPTEGGVDRERIMAEVRARAAQSHPGSTTTSPAGARSAALRRLAPLSLPEPVAARPGVVSLKRLVRRLTGWEIDPVVRQVNRLQQAVIEALERDTGARRAPRA